MDSKLREAIAANTAIKFAGGVSAKDARTLAGDLRTEAGFIEGQSKLSFAAFIKGQTERAVSFHITPGQMEQCPRMDDAAKLAVRDFMRQRYAVHYSELNASHQRPTEDGDQSEEVTDTDEPMEW